MSEFGHLSALPVTAAFHQLLNRLAHTPDSVQALLAEGRVLAGAAGV
jgi:hypothetical protein